jgi:hypothetical protein
VTPAERHARNLARVAELEAEDAAATQGPWEQVARLGLIDQVAGDGIEVTPRGVNCMAYCYGGTAERMTAENADLIVSMRNRNPAVLGLIRGVIERHTPQQHAPGYCYWCPAEGDYFPCADYIEAENALGVGDE